MSRQEPKIREYDFPVEPITRDDRRAMAFELLDELHSRREQLGLSQTRIAELLDMSQCSVSEGVRHVKINRLDIACALAYAVGLKLKLVPWDDTDS